MFPVKLIYLRENVRPLLAALWRQKPLGVSRIVPLRDKKINQEAILLLRCDWLRKHKIFTMFFEDSVRTFFFFSLRLVSSLYKCIILLYNSSSCCVSPKVSVFVSPSVKLKRLRIQGIQMAFRKLYMTLFDWVEKEGLIVNVKSFHQKWKFCGL